MVKGIVTEINNGLIQSTEANIKITIGELSEEQLKIDKDTVRDVLEKVNKAIRDGK